MSSNEIVSVMRQALEALNYLQGIVDTERGPKAAEALRQAIARAEHLEAEKQTSVSEVEPVALYKDIPTFYVRDINGVYIEDDPLNYYTHPQPKENT